MQRTCLVAALALVLALPASAQQIGVPFTSAKTANCLKDAKRRADQRDCIGASAEACRLAMKSPGLGDIALCLTSEADWWGKRMQRAYDAMMEKAAVADARFDTAVNTSAPPFKLTEDLASMQATWEVWREKTCAVEAMLRRGTPYRSTAAATCMMKLTGEQALFLEKALDYN